MDDKKFEIMETCDNYKAYQMLLIAGVQKLANECIGCAKANECQFPVLMQQGLEFGKRMAAKGGSNGKK